MVEWCTDVGVDDVDEDVEVDGGEEVTSEDASGMLSIADANGEFPRDYFSLQLGTDRGTEG